MLKFQCSQFRLFGNFEVLKLPNDFPQVCAWTGGRSLAEQVRIPGKNDEAITSKMKEKKQEKNTPIVLNRFFK